MVNLRKLVFARPCVPPSLPMIRLVSGFCCTCQVIAHCHTIARRFFSVEFDFRRFLFLPCGRVADFVSCVGVVKEWESWLQGALMAMTLAPHQSGSAA